MDDLQSKPKQYVKYVDNVAVLVMNDGENRLNLDAVSGILRCLDEIERSDAKALVTTGTGRFYSNGLDLKWMSQQNETVRADFMKSFRLFQRRLLNFPMPTIAAINGHAMGAGATLTIFHDRRVMRTQRGWFCMVEVHVKKRLGTPTILIMNQRYPPSVVRDVAQFGNRYTGEELLKLGMIDDVTDIEKLIDVVVSMGDESAGPRGLHRDTLAAIKRNFNRHINAIFDKIDKESYQERADSIQKSSKL